MIFQSSMFDKTPRVQVLKGDFNLEMALGYSTGPPECHLFSPYKRENLNQLGLFDTLKL